MALKGSKSMLTFFSFPSSVITVPQYMTSPFFGHLLYSFKRCWVLVIAPRTDRRLTRLLMLEAVPYSSASILLIWLIWVPGGMISEIIDVPLPLAAWRFLMSFFTLKISIC